MTMAPVNGPNSSTEELEAAERELAEARQELGEVDRAIVDSDLKLIRGELRRRRIVASVRVEEFDGKNWVAAK